MNSERNNFIRLDWLKFRSIMPDAWRVLERELHGSEFGFDTLRFTINEDLKALVFGPAFGENAGLWEPMREIWLIV